MKYFLDTEFIEDGLTIDLISIGIVAEDGREFYAINKECDFSEANDWVLQNVLSPLGLGKEGFAFSPGMPYISSSYRNSYSLAKSKKDIAVAVAMLLMPDFDSSNSSNYSILDDLRNFEPSDKPEIWAYYADYDWVVFCQLFGTMMDLPKGFPMYCKDIKQLCDDLGNPQLPGQGEGEHNALIDARWNKKAYEYLMSIKGK